MAHKYFSPYKDRLERSNLERSHWSKAKQRFILRCEKSKILHDARKKIGLNLKIYFDELERQLEKKDGVLDSVLKENVKLKDELKCLKTKKKNTITNQLK